MKAGIVSEWIQRVELAGESSGRVRVNTVKGDEDVHV